MKDYDCPLDFWYYCAEHWAGINNLTAMSTFILNRANAYTSIIGKDGDISNLFQYKWYNWCYYREHKERFPFN